MSPVSRRSILQLMMFMIFGRKLISAGVLPPGYMPTEEELPALPVPPHPPLVMPADFQGFQIVVGRRGGRNAHGDYFVEQFPGRRHFYRDWRWENGLLVCQEPVARNLGFSTLLIVEPNMPWLRMVVDSKIVVSSVPPPPPPAPNYSDLATNKKKSKAWRVHHERMVIYETSTLPLWREAPARFAPDPLPGGWFYLDPASLPLPSEYWKKMPSPGLRRHYERLSEERAYYEKSIANKKALYGENWKRYASSIEWAITEGREAVARGEKNLFSSMRT